MSTDLEVLVRGLYESGHRRHIYGLAKVVRVCSQKESLVFAKVLCNTSRQDICFQEIPRTISRKIRNSSAIVTTKESASSIGRGPCAGNRGL